MRKKKQIFFIKGLIYYMFIFLQTAWADGRNVELKIYHDHIYKIGAIQEFAGNLLDRYVKQIDNFTISKEDIEKVKLVSTSFQKILEEHQKMDPPGEYIELHRLFTNVLKIHIVAFKRLVLGLEKKEMDYINESLEIFDTADNDMNKIVEIMDEEMPQYKQHGLTKNSIESEQLF